MENKSLFEPCLTNTGTQAEAKVHLAKLIIVGLIREKEFQRQGSASEGLLSIIASV